MTTISEYYEEEYRYLLEGGKEFARFHPEQAKYLNLDDPRARDPHVERLLESFAFLAGRIHKRLDDEFPEITHALLSLIYSHYLCPIPSISILEFIPIKGRISESNTIRRGVMVDSEPVEGIQCRFQTCYNVKLYPVSLISASILHSGGDNSISLRFVIEEGIQITDMGLDKIRLYLCGERAETYALYRLLSSQVEEILLHGDNDQTSKAKIKMVGFDEDESVLLYPEYSFIGYRLLEEYFVFPEKFFFVDIYNLEALSLINTASSFEIEIRLNSKVPAGLRVSAENFRLYCTPVINVFPKDAEPIQLDHSKSKYRVLADHLNPQNFEIYSVTSVEGIAIDTGQRREYKPFYSFQHEEGEDNENYYHLTREVSPWDGWDTCISFPPSLSNSNISLELLCTNGNLAKKVGIGDICRPTQDIPGFVRFSNITQPTPSLRPKLGKGLEWKFISHLSLNFVSITSVKTLRKLLEIYNMGNTEANQRKIAGITNVSVASEQILVYGAPVKGMHISITLDEKHFEDEGDVRLFACTLNEFVSLYSSINSFTRLTVKCTGMEESLKWPPVVGKQSTM
ncbi:type VI secretion system baseplate subunit TssF [bacterium]|nr:type VI secretion system baseplate subunit TssF [bacterium]MBU1754243.1 type VI secretion system baseplate subunit TssF [bacterium]